MDLIQFFNIFIALLVITDPLIALPAVLCVTQKQTAFERICTSALAAGVAGAILLAVTWLGDSILNILGIKIAAFQIAGGIVILLLALSLLQAKLSTIKSSKAEVESHGIVIPLAFPVIAGPGAISTIILSTAHFPGLENRLLISIICILIALISGILIYFSSYLDKVLGQTGLNIFNRLGGLILMAIAAQILSSGIKGIF